MGKKYPARFHGPGCVVIEETYQVTYFSQNRMSSAAVPAGTAAIIRTVVPLFHHKMQRYIDAQAVGAGLGIAGGNAAEINSLCVGGEVTVPSLSRPFGTSWSAPHLLLPLFTGFVGTVYSDQANVSPLIRSGRVIQSWVSGFIMLAR